jgi:hypothetical protein
MASSLFDESLGAPEWWQSEAEPWQRPLHVEKAAFMEN